jgi:hypothetical protein
MFMRAGYHKAGTAKAVVLRIQTAARCRNQSSRLVLSRAATLFCQRVALGQELVEFLVLLGKPIGDAFLTLLAGGRGRLFYQLPDVVAKHRDAIIEFGG